MFLEETGRPNGCDNQISRHWNEGQSHQKPFSHSVWHSGSMISVCLRARKACEIGRKWFIVTIKLCSFWMHLVLVSECVNCNKVLIIQFDLICLLTSKLGNDWLFKNIYRNLLGDSYFIKTPMFSKCLIIKMLLYYVISKYTFILKFERYVIARSGNKCLSNSYRSNSRGI